MKKYIYSTNAEDYIKSGLEKIEVKDFEGAFSDFSIAIEMDPNSAEAYYQRGLLLGKEMHKYTKAIKDFTKAIKIKSDFAEAYYDRGVTYVILDDLKNSCTDWQKAKELGHNDAEALLEKYCSKLK